MTAKHILLVDDEEAIAYVFKRYLERAGYRVTALVDPLEALTIGSAGGVDMLVTDFRMPGMTGAGLIDRLRKVQPALPALIVTAYGAEVGTAAGVRVLNKPLPPQELVEAVVRALAPGRAS
jgi:CheY-like chemotaxis protein